MSSRGPTPRQRIEAECASRGRRAVADGCIAMLEGRAADPRLVFALGGPPARWVLYGGRAGRDYWLRVWAARGLLWVREMAARVAARNGVGEALEPLSRLQADSSARVRASAERAVRRLTASAA